MTLRKGPEGLSDGTGAGAHGHRNMQNDLRRSNREVRGSGKRPHSQALGKGRRPCPRKIYDEYYWAQANVDRRA
eukprot:6096308-Alexandrium_andersonii.AAC.1